MKTFVTFAIFMLSYSIIANDVVTINREWRLSGGVRKVFNTPLGTLYQLEPGNFYVPFKGHKKGTEANIPPMGGMLYVSLLKDNERTKRIVVIDFLIRAYPAFEKQKGPNFSFNLIRSGRSELQNDYRQLNGLLEVKSDLSAFLFSNYAPKNRRIIYYRDIPRFRPDFEPLAMRIVFDTVTEETLVSYNGQSTVFTDITGVSQWPKENTSITEGYVLGGDDKNKTSVPVRSIGIITTNEKARWARNRYLEVSSPTVRLYDKMKEVKELKPLLFSPYPYESYMPKTPKPIRKPADLIKYAERDKNPEVQYAVAMRLLYGGENYCYPEEAIKLLEKAAKDDHVLALYQLGVCYYRGYGVAPDLKKALRYLEDAAEFKYQNAEALVWFIQWDVARHPAFMIGEFMEKLKKTQNKYNMIEHDLKHISMLVNSNFSGFVPYSLKDGIFAEYAGKRWQSRNQAKPSYFIDHVINSGYYPAYAAKARYYEALTEDQKIQLLKAGIEAGDIAAVPFLFLALAKQKQLSSSNFTAGYDIIFSEEALYQFLAYAVKNPDLPGVQEYISGDTYNAKKLLKTVKSPDKHILLGLMMLIEKLPPKTRLSIIHDKQNEISEAIGHLLKAAELNNPTAQYILSYLYFRNDLPSKKIDLSSFKSLKMLESAANSGHIKAMLMLAEFEWNNRNFDKAISYIDKACKTNYAPAFYLKGKVLHQSNRNKQEAGRAFLKAAELGDHRALQMLALINSANPKSKQKFWHEFIMADLRYRTYDPYDPYYPKPYQELYKWTQEGFEPQKDIYDEKIKSWMDEKTREFRKL